MSSLLPLSLAQHEVLQDQRAFPGSPHLGIGGYSVLEGAVDAALLAQALAQLCTEQPALRARVSLAGNQLLPLGHTLLPVLRVEAVNEGEDLDQAAQRCWKTWLETRPDPAAAPAWAATWIDARDGSSAILLMAHHAVMDGWGTAQHMRRWAELYSALVTGFAPPAEGSEAWPRHLEDCERYRAGPERERDAEFWRQELPQTPAPLFARPEAQSDTPARDLPAARLARLPVTQQQRAAWAGAAASDGHTEVATFAAALAWHLGRLAQLDEVVIGVPTLNRKGAGHRAALGMYVGVFCLRIPLAGASTPRQLIATAGQQLKRALRHARFPVSALARLLGLAREGRASPFDVLLSFERQDFALRFGAAQVTQTQQLFSGRARYPLGLTVCNFGADQDLALVAEGSPLLGDARQLTLLARRQLALVDAFAAQPDAPLAELPLLPAAEREAVLEGLHADVAKLAEPLSVVERFVAQATLHPQAPALVGDGFASLRYGELRAQMERLAQRLLAAAPLQAGDTVALALPRGPLLVTAMLAVQRAGAAFVPLDLEAPDVRLQALLQQLRPRAWLGAAADVARLAPLHPGWLAADEGEAAPAHALPPWPRPEQPAYALFTSGSTGSPKAVLVSHGALARRFAWMAKVWDLGPADRSLQGTQPGFDPALIELLLPLALGASVALTTPGRSAPEAWAGFALRHGCSFSALVPTTLARLCDGIEALPAAERSRLRLRVACCGGEVLPPALAARWRALTGAQLWNVYGPTEACIFASAWACRDGDDESPTLPIGTPLDDTRLYVLDPELQPLPVGTPGEIWIGGGALAEGYLHEPERTAAAFRADPFLPGGRIYRSGDRGFIDGEGRLQFLGRVDRQLKIRGQRVEPGEVEAALLALPGVQEVAVMGVGQPARLHAWLAPATLDLHALQAQARARLPELLLPGGWTLMDALPRSRTGKLDTHRLPPPEAAPLTGVRAPSGALEPVLLALLRKALGRDDIGVDEDFFALGGDSLAALDWLSAIEQATGLHADLALLAQAPTVARLAARLGAQAPQSPLAQRLSTAAGAPRLFLAASGHGDLLRFQALARALGPDCELHMLQPPPGEPVRSLAALAQAYGEHVQAAAGDEPLLLAGFSVGGVTALETARWLQAQGQAPAAVLLIDTVYPRWLLRQPWLWKGLAWLTRHLYVQEFSMNGRRLGAMFKDQGLVGQVLALHGYRPGRYEGEVLLLRTSGLRRWQGGLFGPWRRLLRLREREVGGLHGSVFEPGLVGGLAVGVVEGLPKQN